MTDLDNDGMSRREGAGMSSSRRPDKTGQKCFMPSACLSAPGKVHDKMFE
jgi:hypothetical protein